MVVVGDHQDLVRELHQGNYYGPHLRSDGEVEELQWYFTKVLEFSKVVIKKSRW